MIYCFTINILFLFWACALLILNAFASSFLTLCKNKYCTFFENFTLSKQWYGIPVRSAESTYLFAKLENIKKNFKSKLEIFFVTLEKCCQ